MYVVRLRRTDGRIVQKAEFPDVRDALRHLDSFVIAFPDFRAELLGQSGVLLRYRPKAGPAARAASG